MSTSSPHIEPDDLLELLTRPQQEHLTHCAPCRDRRRALLDVRRAVGALPRAAEVPASVLALLDGPVRTRRPARKVAALLLAAAVLALALGVALSRGGARRVMDASLAQEIALDHLHYERRLDAAEVRGTREEVVGFFERTLSRRPHIADLEAASLLGGKRCRIGGRWSALVWLDRAGHWLSLFALPQDAVASRGCARAAGVNVCGARDPAGGARVLAGNLPDDEMLRLLDESLQ